MKGFRLRRTRRRRFPLTSLRLPRLNWRLPRLKWRVGRRARGAARPKGLRVKRRLLVGAAVAVAVLAAAIVAALQFFPRHPPPQRMLVTAYCPCRECCGPQAAGITASGRPVSADGGKFVAADRALPFGTRLIVPGYNDGRPVRVLDRGGAIRGQRLDVFFPTHQEARRWGRQWLEVTTVETP